MSKPDGSEHRDILIDNVIQVMRDGVMIIESSGVIAMVNSALCGILGLAEADMVGKGWAQLFLEDNDNLDFSQAIIDVVQSRTVNCNSQVTYRSPDGRRKELIATTSFIEGDDGDVVGVVAVFKDVSELTMLHRRQAELLTQSRRAYEEKREGLERITQAVSHEVRNPVTAIGGLANRLLNKAVPDSEVPGYLERILDAATKLEQIVSQVRSYTNLPSPRPLKLGLSEWLETVLDLYWPDARAQGVNCRVGRESGLVAEFDPTLMATALRYILDNAMEAMPDGGQLSVKTYYHDRWAVIEVADTGPGIKNEDIPYLFDPFFTTKADAVGMSLAVSRRIVQEHGGRLEAESLEDGGTVMRIMLPLPGKEAL